MRVLLLTATVLLMPTVVVAQSADAPELSNYAWGFPVEIRENASFYSVELPLEVSQSVTDPELRDAGVYNSDGKPVPRIFELVNNDRELVERRNPLPTLPLYETDDNRGDEDGVEAGSFRVVHHCRSSRRTPSWRSSVAGSRTPQV